MNQNWVLVTGAARRIGREIALELARRGWSLVLHYHRSAGEAQQLAQDVEKLGQDVVLAELDLARLDLVAKLIPSLAAELGPIRALVNNASLFEPDAKDPTGELHKTINAEAPRVLSEGLYRQLPEGVTGAIVNMLDGVPPENRLHAYNASKNRLRSLTREQARLFAPKLRVNGIEPGPVLPNHRQSTQHHQTLVEDTPLHVTITPQDIARTVAFLLDATAMTGEILHVDGGQHLLTGR